MNPYHQSFNEQRHFEDEMNRFEKEVLSAPTPQSTITSTMPVYFIPHQIQRQLPSQRQTQGQFVPTGQNNVLSNANTGGQFNQQTVNYTVTPMQVPSVVHSVPSTSSGSSGNKSKSKNGGDKGKKQKKTLRIAGGQVWEDTSLADWDSDDFRIFCGDLGNDVTDDVLTRAFNRFNSFTKAKVVRDKRTNKSRGYGFVSFKNPQDFARAMKEMNGKYVGSRPIKLRKSNWRDRNLDVVKKKNKQKAKLGLI